MQSEIITRERFSSIINSIPEGALGTGFSQDEVYYSYARNKSGTYKGEPYTKPAYIQVSTNQKRFWIELIDQNLRFTYDPDGGFNPIPLAENNSLSELEGYFTHLEDRLQITSRKKQTSISAKLAIGDKDLWAFIQAILPWCVEEQQVEVQRATQLALTAPHQYLQTNREQLARRGIDKPIQNLYVIALIDEMQKIGAAIEIDWKTDCETVFWHVASIASNLGLELQQTKDVSTSQTHEILKELSQDLASQDQVLATIDIDSDSYVLHIVPAAVYSRSVELAKKLGIKVNKL